MNKLEVVNCCPIHLIILCTVVANNILYSPPPHSAFGKLSPSSAACCPTPAVCLHSSYLPHPTNPVLLITHIFYHDSVKVRNKQPNIFYLICELLDFSLIFSHTLHGFRPTFLLCILFILQLSNLECK